MTKWEYKTFWGILEEDQLNALGAEGWELAGVAAGSPIIWVFKRAV